MDDDALDFDGLLPGDDPRATAVEDRGDGPSARGTCRVSAVAPPLHESGGLDERDDLRAVAADPLPGGPTACVPLRNSAARDPERAGDRTASVAPSAAVAGALAELRVTWRLRRALLRAEMRLTQQINAVEREVAAAVEARAAEGEAGPLLDMPPAAIAALATSPLAAAKGPIAAQRKALDKRLARLVQRLPAWRWVEGVRGFGPTSLAGIVGEAGDLAMYQNPGKLWKRLGLAVIDGQRQRLVKGEGAIRQGFSPERRAIVWNLGAAIIKSGGPDSPYRALYAERKAYELARAPDMQPAIAHARAKRYVEKRLVKHAWRIWRWLHLGDGIIPAPAWLTPKERAQIAGTPDGTAPALLAAPPGLDLPGPHPDDTDELPPATYVTAPEQDVPGGALHQIGPAVVEAAPAVVPPGRILPGAAEVQPSTVQTLPPRDTHAAPAVGVGTPAHTMPGRRARSVAALPAASPDSTVPRRKPSRRGVP